MRPLSPILAIALLLSVSCSKVAPSSNSRKEATSGQPTDVSGGFGLTMQCSVVNRDVPNATSSQISCLVRNDDGTKYTGSIQDLKARVSSKSSASGIEARPVVNPSESPSQITIIADDLTPLDATSIEISGSFDNKKEKLTSDLLSSFALVCNQDLNLFVRAGSSADNIYCTKEQPCSKISQAILLLPETINCKINITVVPGYYQESLIIRNISITEKGSVTIDKDPAPNPPLAEKMPTDVVLQPPMSCDHDENPDTRECSAVRISRVQNSGSLTISNLFIEGNYYRPRPKVIDENRPTVIDENDYYRPNKKLGSFGYGVLVTGGSAVKLKNIRIENALFGTVVNGRSIVGFADNTLIQDTLTGISAVNSDLVTEGSVTINPITSDFSPQLSNGHGLILYDAKLSVFGELVIGKSSVGIALDQNSLLQLSNSEFNLLSIKNPSSRGISLTAGSRVIGLQSRSERDKLRKNETDPPRPEPRLQITNCGEYCITMGGRSYLNLGAFNETSDRNLFTLELRGGPEPAPEPATLFYSSDYSNAYLDFVNNAWCDQRASNNLGLASKPSIYVMDGSSFYLKREKNNPKAFANCPKQTNQKRTINNFQVYQEPIASPCRPGFYSFTPSGATSDVCLGNIGFTQISEHDQDSFTIFQPLLIDQIDDKL